MKVEYSVLDDLVFRKFKRLNLEILMHYITLQIRIFWGEMTIRKVTPMQTERIQSRYICDLIMIEERKMLILSIACVRSK